MFYKEEYRFSNVLINAAYITIAKSNRIITDANPKLSQIAFPEIHRNFCLQMELCN